MSVETSSVNNGLVKKTQVVQVSKTLPVWQSSESSYGDAEKESPVARNNSDINIGLLDFMNVEEFIKMLKIQTGENYGTLWNASSQLAMQLKASKSLLSVNSYMTMGKTKIEILEKLIESTKFTLGADQVYIFEYSAGSNSLIVSHSNIPLTLQQEIPLSNGTVEGMV